MHGIVKRLLESRHRHPVLGATRAGHAGLDGAQVEVKQRIKGGDGGAIDPEHPLGLGVGFDQRHDVVGATGATQVVQGFGVDGEEPTGRAVFGGHIGDGGAVSEAQATQAVTTKFDKFIDHAMFAQQFGHAQHQVGGGCTWAQAPRQTHPNHFGGQHGEGLAEQYCLGFDATHTPTQHAQAIDHGGVAVGANQGVRHGYGFAVDGFDQHTLRQKFEVDLVTNAGHRGDDAKVREALLAPSQKFVALAVTAKFEVSIELQRHPITKGVYLHRVVNDQIGLGKRVDERGVATELLHGIAHGGQIDHCRHAGEVLHQYARRLKGHFA